MLTSLNELVLLVHVGTACLKIQVPHVQYLRVCARVFITPCLHAAALPTGIRSFRHIFTSSAFKGINIALAAVAGLNGWLGGKEGGWMSNAIPSLFLPCLCLPLSFFFFFSFAVIWYDVRSTAGGCCSRLSAGTRSRSHGTSMRSLFAGNIRSFSSALTLVAPAALPLSSPVARHPSMHLQKYLTKRGQVEERRG